ncbi:MAG TPA: formate dehydrogenase accessory protein FdhE [Terriglobales bacterium]|nr:formate dehydrogenase accessory protein FdhE [Terriglobales bacterium]
MANRRFRWEDRIVRARELQDLQPAAAAPLRFYEAVLGFQNTVAHDFKIAADSSIPLRAQIELAFACSKIPALLALAREHGPDALRRHARTLEQAGATRWQSLLASVVDGNPSDVGALDGFFARACLQPIAENLQLQLPAIANYSQGICPACGGAPQAAVLRPEGEGASRWLLCSFCLREWVFRRIVCPWCGEEDKEKLPRYSAEEYKPISLEGCDTCKRYLKAVDMTLDGHAEPLVDEAAAAVLDLWAVNNGYIKIIPNLIGL